MSRNATARMRSHAASLPEMSDGRRWSCVGADDLLAAVAVDHEGDAGNVAACSNQGLRATKMLALLPPPR